MSGLSSWSCISVQGFLESANWQGQALENSSQATNSSDFLRLSQPSWSCISVEKFVKLCNWKGKPLAAKEKEADVLPGANKPELASAWPSLSVQEFLEHSNWKGKIFVQPSQGVETAKAPDSSKAKEYSAPLGQEAWSSLSVRQFFECSNWEGLPIRLNSEAPADLGLPVNDFFQHIPWQGKPEIGALPQVNESELETPPADSGPSVTDLFDLF